MYDSRVRKLSICISSELYIRNTVEEYTYILNGENRYGTHTHTLRNLCYLVIHGELYTPILRTRRFQFFLFFYYVSVHTFYLYLDTSIVFRETDNRFVAHTCQQNLHSFPNGVRIYACACCNV